MDVTINYYILSLRIHVVILLNGSGTRFQMLPEVRAQNCLFLLISSLFNDTANSSDYSVE
jgi:hypothetical protein